MIYLDNNATTAVAPEVFDAMRPYLTGDFGNPSSSHSMADVCREAVEDARRSVAAFIGAERAQEIVFTSGGTESDNWAILGALEARPEKKKIITTKVEHEAVRKVCEKLGLSGFDIVWLDVGENGILDPETLRTSLDARTAIVSIMMANNETGVIFPVHELAEIVKANSDAAFHVDGVNAAGKVPIDLRDSNIDLFSISGHKFQGPKGVGALYVRTGFDIESNAIGGGQESGRRAGTEAVHQIAGLGAAAKLASVLEPMNEVRRLRDTLENHILMNFDVSSLNGDRNARLPNTSNISFEGLNGELILAKLDDLGICVSTGSACNETNHVSSPVLRAMEIPYSKAMGAIRFSLGRNNTADEIAFVINALPDVIGEVRSIAA